jgi:ABC transporter substrate binding protein (PQQ-dependent alcohol dehydrogenase system)
MKRFLAAYCALAFAAATTAAIPAALAAPAEEPSSPASAAPAGGETTAPVDIGIAYLTRTVDHAPPRNDTQPIPKDEGLFGAKVGIDDNNTTGRFTKQNYRLRALTLPLNGEAESQFRKLVAAGYKYVILNLPADDVVKLADLPEAKDVVIFNAGAREDSLRNADCRANVFHTIASRAMVTDALAQYLIRKKWPRWLLAVGKTPGDRLYADNVVRAAKKFGAKIVDERSWTYSAEAIRRGEQAEIPVFTQGPDYDVLVVADETDEFGDELMYRTWDPRPVAGTQGLIPTDWHPAHDQWGATQLENRFEAMAHRFMTARDFAAWTAVRAVGEAATRTQSGDYAKIRDYLLSDDLSIGVFKGVGANFRAWDHQLREPILLAAPYTVVSVSPQPEFLHPVSNLDTLGFDKPETTCKFK